MAADALSPRPGAAAGAGGGASGAAPASGVTVESTEHSSDDEPPRAADGAVEPESLRFLTVKELRSECRSHGLKVSGNKDTLVVRLAAYLITQSKNRRQGTQPGPQPLVREAHNAAFYDSGRDLEESLVERERGAARAGEDSGLRPQLKAVPASAVAVPEWTSSTVSAQGYANGTAPPLHHFPPYLQQHAAMASPIVPLHSQGAHPPNSHPALDFAVSQPQASGGHLHQGGFLQYPPAQPFGGPSFPNA